MDLGGCKAEAEVVLAISEPDVTGINEGEGKSSRKSKESPPIMGKDKQEHNKGDTVPFPFLSLEGKTFLKALHIWFIMTWFSKFGSQVFRWFSKAAFILISCLNVM